MPNLDDLLRDIETLRNADDYPITDINSIVAILRTAKQAVRYIENVSKGDKPETVLTDYLFRPLMEDDNYLDLRLDPQTRAGNGWVDYLIRKYKGGNPIAIELKPLHKIKGTRLVRNSLKQELKDEHAVIQIKQYLRDYEYVLFTNMDEIYYFNREAQLDFRPFWEEPFLDFIRDVRATVGNIWDTVKRKEDTTPKLDLDKRFFADLKKWYSEFQEISFVPCISREEKVVQILNKFIFLKTLEDYNLIPFNYIREKYEEKVRMWYSKGTGKVFQEFFTEVNEWSYEYYDTELFKGNIFDDILPEADNFEKLREATEKVLGFTEWAKTFGLGLVHYNYRNIDEDIFGSTYETFLAEARREHGIHYTPKIVTGYMSKTLTEMIFSILADRLLETIARSDFAEAELIAYRIINLKVIDPACGSGSFLIKMLQYIWEVYKKLDNETLWATHKEIIEQPDIAIRKDSTCRIRMILGIGEYEIEKRKVISLIVLRHLFGIDLDRKAIDVAKVNLWKEAVKLEPGLYNYQILPSRIDHVLPGLELNFVVADSLADLPISETTKILSSRFRNEIIHLHEIREEYLTNPFNPARIEEAVSIKRRVRQELFLIFREKECALDTPPTFVPLEFFFAYFDMEGNPLSDEVWGFNGVVGNPPYGAEYEGSDMLRFKYFPCEDTDEPQSKDSYGLFTARALQLLKNEGVLSFLISDTWRTIRSFRPLRRMLLDETSIIHIIDMPPWIFDATVNTCILTLKKESPDEGHIMVAADLHSIPKENERRWQELAENLKMVGQDDDIQTTTYATYSYPQMIIKSNSNLPFLVASPKLFSLMCDTGNVVRPDLPDLPVISYLVELNGRNLNLFKLGDSYDSTGRLKTWLNTGLFKIVSGIKTGSNKKYLGIIKDLETQKKLPLAVSTSEVLNYQEIMILSEEEKSDGIQAGKHFIPFEMGMPSNTPIGILPCYYQGNTSIVIDWSNSAVSSMRMEGHSDLANAEFRFLDLSRQISFSFAGVYAPTFRLSVAPVFQNAAPRIFLRPSDNINGWLGFLNSKLARYLMKSFVNHTVNFGVDDIKDLPCLTDFAFLAEKVESIIQHQKENPDYSYNVNEQIDIDKLVYEAYGLNEEDITEVETWYARRYPNLAEAEKKFKERE